MMTKWYELFQDLPENFRWVSGLILLMSLAWTVAESYFSFESEMKIQGREIIQISEKIQIQGKHIEEIYTKIHEDQLLLLDKMHEVNLSIDRLHNKINNDNK